MSSTIQQPHSKARLHVQLPTELLEEFRALSRSNERTLAGEVRHALAAHLRAQQAKA